MFFSEKSKHFKITNCFLEKIKHLKIKKCFFRAKQTFQNPTKILKLVRYFVLVNHQRLVCLENSRIEPTPEQVRPNFWIWKESEGGVQHRFLCHVVARNLPAEPRNLHAELLNFLSQNLANKCLFREKQTFEDKNLLFLEKNKHLKIKMFF